MSLLYWHCATNAIRNAFLVCAYWGSDQCVRQNFLNFISDILLCIHLTLCRQRTKLLTKSLGTLIHVILLVFGKSGKFCKLYPYYWKSHPIGIMVRSQTKGANIQHFEGFWSLHDIQSQCNEKNDQCIATLLMTGIAHSNVGFSTLMG